MRHPSTQDVLDHLTDYKPATGEVAKTINHIRSIFATAAQELVDTVDSNADVTYALRIMTDAKNWFVLAALTNARKNESDE